MRPVKPRPDGRPELTLGEMQQEYYEPLPGTIGPAPEFEVTTEWEPTADELKTLQRGGKVQIKVWTFGHKFHPIQVNILPL